MEYMEELYNKQSELIFKEYKRLYTSFIIYVLKQYSSKHAPLSVTEISSKVCTLMQDLLIMPDLSNNDNMLNSTVKRTLKILSTWKNNDENELFKKMLGGEIHDMMLSQKPYTKLNSELPYVEYANVNGKNIKHFYYFEPLFQEEELLILSTSIATNPFLMPTEIKELSDKIFDLSPSVFNHSTNKSIYKNNNQHISKEPKLLYNMVDINYFIHNGLRMKILYGKYNFQKELEPKSANKSMTEIEPITITWANGFSYLIAKNKYNYSNNEVTAYRIDRIMKIAEAINDKGCPIKCEHLPSDFDAMQYQKSHPVMQSGDVRFIQFLAKEENEPLANLLLDTFGMEYQAEPINDIFSQKYLHMTLQEITTIGESWYMIRTKASVRGTLHWAKQHVQRVLIISPEDIVETIKKDLLEGIGRYK